MYGRMECWNLFHISLFMFGELAYAIILANGYAFCLALGLFIGYCIMDVFSICGKLLLLFRELVLI